jgi:glycosyltransferase 2 family protein
MNHRVARGLRWLLTAVILAFLVVFARTIDWTAAWSSMRHASLPLLVAAIGVNFLSICLKGVRWWLFLRPAGVPSFALALRATIAGAGLNNVLVANGGDAARVVFVSRATGVRSSTILATLALERMFDAVGFVVLLVFGITFFELPHALEKWRRPAEALLVVIAALLIWFVYTARNIKPEHVPERRAKARTFWGRVRRYLSGFAESTRSLATGPRFLGALVLSMLSWAGQFATFALAAAAAHVTMRYSASLAGLLAINLGLLIRATPGNVGFFQFVYALTAEQFGIARDDAIAVSLLIQTLQIIPTTIVGIALAPEFIFKKGARKEIQSMTEHREPILLGDSPKKSEKLGGTAG